MVLNGINQQQVGLCEKLAELIFFVFLMLSLNS
jgi:hypothetical protein